MTRMKWVLGGLGLVCALALGLTLDIPSQNEKPSEFERIAPAVVSEVVANTTLHEPPPPLLSPRKSEISIWLESEGSAMDQLQPAEESLKDLEQKALLLTDHQVQELTAVAMNSKAPHNQRFLAVVLLSYEPVKHSSNLMAILGQVARRPMQFERAINIKILSILEPVALNSAELRQQLKTLAKRSLPVFQEQIEKSLATLENQETYWQAKVASLHKTIASPFDETSEGVFSLDKQNPTFAKSKSCLEPADVERILKTFQIQLEETPDLCDPQGKTRKILDVLLFAEGLKFSGKPLPQPWNQEILPANWLQYLSKLSPLILHSSVDPKTRCIGKTSYFAYIKPSVKNTLFICDATFDPDYAQGISEILSTLLHESRHHQGYSHVRCTKGDMESGGCDPSLNFKGSYAVDVEALLNIALRANNVHAVTKDSALHSALAIAYTNINEAPYEIGPVLYLQNAEGEVFRYDGRFLTAIKSLQFPASHLVPRADTELVMFPLDGVTSAARFRSWDGLHFVGLEAEGSFLATYTSWDSETRQKLVDVVYDENFFARILENNIEGLLADSEVPKFFSLEFSNGKPVRIFTVQEIPSPELADFFVLNDQNELFKVNVRLAPTQAGASLVNPGLTTTTSITKVVNPYANLKSIARLKEGIVLLDLGGQVWKSTVEGLVVDPALKGQRFVRMSRALNVSKDLGFIYQH